MKYCLYNIFLISPCFQFISALMHVLSNKASVFIWFELAWTRLKYCTLNLKHKIILSLIYLIKNPYDLYLPQIWKKGQVQQALLSIFHNMLKYANKNITKQRWYIFRSTEFMIYLTLWNCSDENYNKTKGIFQDKHCILEEYKNEILSMVALFLRLFNLFSLSPSLTFKFRWHSSLSDIPVWVTFRY